MNYYYHADPKSDLTLSSEESSHAIKVLRKKTGDTIHLMDGLGHSYEARITDDNFRRCKFEIVSTEKHDRKPFSIHIAIAPTKNIDRIEWFVEKACELGADRISFIDTKRTERSKVKIDRLDKKAISAMKQSKSFWKCQIDEITTFSNFIKEPLTGQKFIAFVETGSEVAFNKMIQTNMDSIIMIGPEGDFTFDEVKSAQNQGFQTTNLGKNILRTETAGIIAAHTVNIINGY
ncbi:RsmE family RNA methyltransferase [Reichenbachiella versicolor]|uniref:RsmE family RNA methyltransferase n=1 Tax=Reichenbachiella versicolor TaxID=1821036 RepID=UPI000D6DC75A|nr:RsmE family RNA methyltransferase [Reichenbachiella versicolor]